MLHREPVDRTSRCGRRDWRWRCAVAATVQPAPAQTCSKRCSAASITRRAAAAAGQRLRRSIRLSPERPLRRIAVSPNSESAAAARRPGFCVRTCDGLLFPGARQRRHVGGRDVPLVLPGGADPGVLRAAEASTTRSRRTASATPISTTAFLYRTRKVDELHLQRHGRVRAGAARVGQRSDAAAGRHRRDQRRPRRPSTAIGGQDRRVHADRKSGGPSEWRLRLMSIKVAPAPDAASHAGSRRRPKKSSRSAAARSARRSHR